MAKLPLVAQLLGELLMRELNTLHIHVAMYDSCEISWSIYIYEITNGRCIVLLVEFLLKDIVLRAKKYDPL